MKHKNIIIVTALLFLITAITSQCNSGDKKEKSGDSVIIPVDLPSIVPGFNFPEDSNKIYSWLNDPRFPNNYDSVNVYNHAWGVWAGLTSKTNQVYAGDSLLVFETWQGITEIREVIKEINSIGAAKESLKKRGRTLLDRPNQFEHGATLLNKRKTAAANVINKDTIDTNTGFWVTVSYSPAAASYAIKNKILDTSVLNSYKVAGGIGSIPPFPNTAITIKPTYIVGSETDSLIQIPVWPGAPDTAKAFPSSVWPRCVYADVHNRQQSNKAVVPAMKNQKNPDSIKAATCNLSDFINFKVDALMAAQMNAADSTEDGSGFAKAGSIAILVAMHVTTKEISNWTWQTFYWAPNPAMPFDPSSNLAASLKPSQLQGAAAHYALATGYAMVLPNQPISGGTNTGVMAMLGYNPYLEAGFFGVGKPVGPFPDSIAAFKQYSRLIQGEQFGVQTNCMTCHGRATADGGLGYTTDEYLGMNEKIFIDKVQVDFAWSITNNLILDSIKYKPK